MNGKKQVLVEMSDNTLRLISEAAKEIGITEIEFMIDASLVAAYHVSKVVRKRKSKVTDIKPIQEKSGVVGSVVDLPGFNSDQNAL